ncbi:FmdB family zinc ribbon protein [Modestobacter sp. URMC 112]
MPTYQYVCTNPEVKHEFEVVQSFSDPAVSTCTECGAPVRKVYGSVGVVFKGSGFYRTDSRKPESSGTGSSSAKESAATGSKDGSSTKDSAPKKESSSTPSPAGSSSGGGSGSGSKAAN